MLLSNQTLINYRFEELKENKDIAFLIKYMYEHYKLSETDVIDEIYNNQ